MGEKAIFNSFIKFMHNNHLVMDPWERHNGSQTAGIWSEKKKKYEGVDKDCHIGRLHEMVIKK